MSENAPPTDPDHAGPLRVRQLMRKALAEHVAPAIAFGVVRSNSIVLCELAGRTRPDGPPVTPATIYDLASLTKPLTTTLWFWHLHAHGRIDLDTPIGEVVSVAAPALAECPVWRLLTHTTGLPAHRPFFEGLGRSVLHSGRHASARTAIRRMIAHTTLVVQPGEREIYSDLGYLLLEQICEAISAPLENAWPGLPGHGVDALHFRPLADHASTSKADAATEADAATASYAATEACPWRERLLQGEVHDDNCWTLGGVGGHAGTFGTLNATLSAAQAWLRAARGDGRALELPDDVVPMSLLARWRHPLGGRVLGWDTPSAVGSTAGQHFGPRSFGHLGFTGTSIWIDPDADVGMVLLTNRVCPSRASTGIRWLRPQLHDVAWRCFT